MAPSRMDSDVEMDSGEEISKRKSKSSRHRSRSPRKHQKKHKKEKKRRRKRSGSSTAGDTGDDGGDTPTRTRRDTVSPVPVRSMAAELPGIDKYKSDHSDDESEKRREQYSRKKKKSRSRSRSKHRKRSRSRDRKDEKRREKYNREDKPQEDARRRSEKAEPQSDFDIGDGGGTKEIISLSIEETNKLRAKLGLKPLNVTEKPVEEEDDGTLEGTLIPGDRNKTRHLPAQHWGEKAKQEKLRERFALNKDKRNIMSKLAAVKGLGDSDSDDDAEKWVQKQKSAVEAKKEAEKLAKQMEELDNEFGVGDLVTEKLASDRSKEYSAKNLRGLRVEHGFDNFSEKETILTLKDQNILADEYEDVLINVNIKDDERTKKSLQNIKAGKEGYQAYDQEEVDELTGEVKRKGILYQYNEEIDGEKKDSFVLEQQGEYNEEEARARELAKIRQKLKLGNMQSLETPQMRLASDYYDDEEMSKFKKPKNKKDKKKKIRKKMLKADDLLKLQDPDSLLPSGFGDAKKKRVGRIIDDDEELNSGVGGSSAGVVYDDLPVVEDLSHVAVDDEDAIGINSLLRKAQKLKNKKDKSLNPDRIAEELITQGEDVEMEDGKSGLYADDLVLEETEEFCRNLGEVTSTYEQSGLNEDVHSDLLDFERSLQSEVAKIQEGGAPSTSGGRKGGWEAVGGQNDKGSDEDSDMEDSSRSRGEASVSARPAILDEEALAGQGMGAALQIAVQKGYLEKGQLRPKSSGLQNLVCKKYNIEDKSRDYEEDDRKRRGRDRGYSGPTTTFSEKKGYKPEVVLEYLDDSGRQLTSKEAFRHLSHKFHGKTSGKLKTEKRQRKVLEDQVMKKMSSTDTPLATLQKQQEKTKELATPYLILSGNKQLSSLKK